MLLLAEITTKKFQDTKQIVQNKESVQITKWYSKLNQCERDDSRVN